MNLFGEKEQSRIRTLGFYQPFGSLMLYGKIETRWIMEDRKPPFPLGRYLFYTTQKNCDNPTLFDWCGAEIMKSISDTLGDDSTKDLNGYAIGIGDLVSTRLLTKEDEGRAFVKFIGREQKLNYISAKYNTKDQWALIFENVQRIEPFQCTFGKQGVGFVPESEIDKIKIIDLCNHK